MSDIENVKATLADWMECLEKGDVEGLLATCDPSIIVANEGQETTVGIEAMRAKYTPRLAAYKMKSIYDLEHIAVYGDLAVMIGPFTNLVTDKKTGMQNEAKGRLALNYRRHANGEWKLLLDMDNN